MRTLSKNSRTRFSLLGACLFVLGGSACSWDRFSQLGENAPVVELGVPDEYAGSTGRALTYLQSGENTELYVAGTPGEGGGLVYSLGTSQKPDSNSTDRGHCPLRDGSDVCNAVAQPTGVIHQSGSKNESELCFISGLAPSEGIFPSVSTLWSRCQSGLQVEIPIPVDLQSVLEGAAGSAKIRLDSARGDSSFILAAAEKEGRAWYYSSLGGTPTDILKPDLAGEDFGSQVSVGKGSAGHLFAVSALSKNQVWVFRSETENVQLLACLQGGNQWGRTLTWGDVDGDAWDDLVIADEKTVRAFSGAVLEGQSFNGKCEIPPGALLSELQCTAHEDIEGCSVSKFGDSVTIGDINGNGKREIIVGAPLLKVRGESKAGALQIFDALSGNFIDSAFVSDLTAGAHFGASVQAVPQAGQDLLAVGAPGQRKTYLLYCSGGAKDGLRCDF